MKTLEILSKLGAERLKNEDPNRDAKRGGNDKGRTFKRVLPMPEKDSEVTTKWVEQVNAELAKVKSDIKLTLIDLVEKGLRLYNQAEMNQRAAEKYGRTDGSTTKTPKDTSNLETI